MKQVVSGSGVRYRSVDADRPYELHAKGQDGTFYYGPEADAPAAAAAWLREQCR